MFNQIGRDMTCGPDEAKHPSINYSGTNIGPSKKEGACYFSKGVWLGTIISATTPLDSFYSYKSSCM